METKPEKGDQRGDQYLTDQLRIRFDVKKIIPQSEKKKKRDTDPYNCIHGG